MRIFIYGAGGFGVEVLTICRQSADLEPVAFLDADPHKRDTVVDGLPVRGGLELLDTLRTEGITRGIVAVGENVTRVSIAETLESRGFELVSAIDPLASISPSARIGRHVVMGPRAIICVHATVGDHAVISAGAIADHDTQIGRGVFLGPAVRLAGGVGVADLARIEIGAAVIPGRQVQAGATIQAGAVVIRDVDRGATVTGVPADTRGGTTSHSRFVPDALGQSLNPAGPPLHQNNASDFPRTTPSASATPDKA